MKGSSRRDVPTLRRALISALLLLGTTLGPAASSASAGPFTVRTLHFDTVVGPQRDHHCDVVGDLYRPAGATRSHPAPAILTTNGFGGSKDDQAAFARAAASRGYVVLSYSGLGFGGSGCRIELDDRDWDGAAGSQLVTFLGGGKAAKDGTRVDYVVRDRRAHDGRHHRFDPRVGMVGGSYGGQIQFAIAGIDPRLDTIVPIITWNDLAYSLVPNNTDFRYGVTSATPGVPKFEWASLFFSLGIADGIAGASADPSRNVTTCPNFDPRVCPSFVKNATLNYPDETTLELLRHASVESFRGRIRIPTLLAQGQADTLFNLNEAAATYGALRRRHVPVAMLWQSWGHSDGSPAPGEFDEAHPDRAYESLRILGWFNHYLKGEAPRPPLDFCFFRDWVHYRGLASPAYRCAPRYPLSGRRRFYLSGSSDLVSRPSEARTGQAMFVTPAEGGPTSYSETSGVEPGLPTFDAPGTFAAFRSAPLARNLDVAGVPTVRLRISAPLQPVSGGASPTGKAVVFFKLYDVAPDGTRTLPHRLISPVRIPTSDRTIVVTLPGIVHRFPKGHRLELVVAGSDAAYRGDTLAHPVSITTVAASPDVLTLPFATVHDRPARHQAPRRHRPRFTG